MKKLLLTLLTVLLAAPLGKAASENLELWFSTTRGGSGYSPKDKWELFYNNGSYEKEYPGTSEKGDNLKYLLYKSKKNSDYVKITFSADASNNGFTFSTSSSYGLRFSQANTKVTIETSSPLIKVNSISISGTSKAKLTDNPFAETAVYKEENNVTYTVAFSEPASDAEVTLSGNYVYFGHLTIDISVPLEAPTLDNKPEAYKDHLPSYYDGELRYLEPTTNLVGIKAPAGTKTEGYSDPIMYWAMDKEPVIDENHKVGPVGDITLPEYPVGSEHILYVAAIDENDMMGRSLQIKCRRVPVPKPEFEIISKNAKVDDGTILFAGNRLNLKLKRNSTEGRPLQRICWRIFDTDRGDDFTKNSYRSGNFIDAANGTMSVYENMLTDAESGNLKPDKDYYIHVYTQEYQEDIHTIYFSDAVVIPVRLTGTTKYNSIKGLIDDGENPDPELNSDGKLVSFDIPLTIQGAYSTALNNTDYLYVSDRSGNAIKVVSRGNTRKAFPESYKASELNDGTASATVYSIPMRGLVGRYRHNDGFPEIEVRNADADFMPYLDEPTPTTASDNTPAKYTRSTVTRDDFNGHRILTGMTKLDGLAVADRDGNVFRLADRLQSNAMSVWTSADNGKRYTIECFIGQIDGELTIFPIKITPDTPRPVASFAGGNIIDEADGDVHVINNTVTLNFRPEYAGTEVTYERSGDGVTWSPCGDELSFYLPDGAVYTLRVRSKAKNGTVCANPLELTFRHHVATPLASIEKFKEEYLDAEGYLPAEEIREGYYRMTGEAVVEQVTPYYIYVRDNIENPGSYNHLLIYNDNGWDNAPRVTDASAPEGWRKLKAGDILTDFALIASATPQGNLRSDATGYARTFTVKSGATSKPVDYDDLRKVQYETADAEGYFENFTFGKDDRMMHYTFENVLVHRRPNPDYSSDALIVVENEDGTVTKYNDPRKRPEDIVDEYVYTLKLGRQTKPDETTGLDIRFNVFTGKRGGWQTSYDPERQNEVYYTITGVVVRDLKRSASGYSIAMLDYDLAAHAKAPAAIYISGNKGAEADEDGSFTYIHNGKVTIEKAPDADPAAVIYYTLDGTDPKSNRLRKTYTGEITLPEGERTVTVRAFASWPGAAPSDEVSATFRRLAEERTYILNFINDAHVGTPYHFNGTVKVAAIGGDYMFVRGVAGHYLPIHRDSKTDSPTPWTKDWEGQYLTDFVIGAERVGNIMRGAKVTDDYAPFLSSPLGSSRPAGLTHDIEIVPDIVTEITAANARRLVSISNVTLEGVEFEADATAFDTEWTLTPNKGHDKYKSVKVNHTVLEYTMPEKGTNGRYYNVTGFVMLDEDGTPELWPTAIERVESAKSIKASFDSNAKVTELPTEDDYALRTYCVEFYPQTMVTLSYEGSHAANATIYYIFTPDEQAPAADAKWNVYGQPFAVISSGYVHAYVSVPGMEESVHTHIELTKAEKSSKVSGRVVFRTEAQPDKVIVYIEPAEQPAGEYSIYYTTDERVTLSPETGTLYTGRVELKESAWLTAILVEKGKEAGEVCGTNVWVNPSVTGIDGIDGDGAESAVRVEGSDIIAPEGSEVYDLSGRKVSTANLAPGIYLVRLPDGKAVKVRV